MGIIKNSIGKRFSNRWFKVELKRYKYVNID